MHNNRWVQSVTEYVHFANSVKVHYRTKWYLHGSMIILPEPTKTGKIKMTSNNYFFYSYCSHSYLLDNRILSILFQFGLLSLPLLLCKALYTEQSIVNNEMGVRRQTPDADTCMQTELTLNDCYFGSLVSLK